MQPLPPAAACHRDQANYNTEDCAEVNSQWKNTEFHANDPISSMWQNYNNYSCMPDAASSCSNAGYPVYVVAARTGQDVVAAVNFARTKNIRGMSTIPRPSDSSIHTFLDLSTANKSGAVNIKSTGHDFLGYVSARLAPHGEKANTAAADRSNQILSPSGPIISKLKHSQTPSSHKVANPPFPGLSSPSVLAHSGAMYPAPPMPGT
jgi:hypothetical protein